MLRDLWQVLKQAAIQWYGDKTFQLGAALAYYGVFAIAPMLVIAVAIAGMIFGDAAAKGQLVHQLEQVMGPTLAKALEETLSYAHLEGSGGMATVISFVVLAFGALGVFMQLQAALDTIWGVEPKADRGLWSVVTDRFFPFLLVLCVGALLCLSLAANTVLTFLYQFYPSSSLPGGTLLWELLHRIVLLGFLTALFAVIFKVLPDIKIRWSNVWVGGGVTAVLFALGSYLIGLYLGRSSAASAYGAAGSLVVVLLWVYYSSQIVLYGAEFTQVYAHYRGETIQPAENAVPLSPAACARQGLAAGHQRTSTPATGPAAFDR